MRMTRSRASAIDLVELRISYLGKQRIRPAKHRLEQNASLFFHALLPKWFRKGN